ncbi:hypothetical protein BC936DRAFT_147046 [Jimgerdemannia flammicorona]|uniref:Uncharacterized protein n=1 Tax=Jimgerdemannia flammicorona TaxID=994334 RepID=A0A433D6A2_9FUNG|nr:hypothetical protein BC936DRAFT_147046 [Jimgerdemannia flammicorona]
MDPVDYGEVDEVGLAAVRRLADDDIPFFRGGDDVLGFGYLLFGQLPVARELRDIDSIGFETSLKVADHLLDEGLHGDNAPNLERVQVDIVRSLVVVLADFVQNGEHGDRRDWTRLRLTVLPNAPWAHFGRDSMRISFSHSSKGLGFDAATCISSNSLPCHLSDPLGSLTFSLDMRRDPWSKMSVQVLDLGRRACGPGGKVRFDGQRNFPTCAALLLRIGDLHGVLDDAPHHAPLSGPQCCRPCQTGAPDDDLAVPSKDFDELELVVVEQALEFILAVADVDPIELQDTYGGSGFFLRGVRIRVIGAATRGINVVRGEVLLVELSTLRVPWPLHRQTLTACRSILFFSSRRPRRRRLRWPVSLSVPRPMPPAPPRPRRPRL